LKKLLRKSAVAESAAAACLAFRSRFRPGGGSGRRPKLAFIGWQRPLPGVVMCRRSDPAMEACGKTGRARPPAIAAADTAATNPEAIDSTYPSTPVIWPAKNRPGRLLHSSQG